MNGIKIIGELIPEAIEQLLNIKTVLSNCEIESRLKEIFDSAKKEKSVTWETYSKYKREISIMNLTSNKYNYAINNLVKILEL
jgi:hypothetical protein